jgi:hypothetical protein
MFKKYNYLEGYFLIVKTNFVLLLIRFMKKNILSILILFSVTICTAQKFNGGIIAGLANTEVLGTNPYKVGFNKVGFTIGLFTELPLSEKSNLRMEMNFIQKGSYIPPHLGPDTVSNGPDTSLRLRLNYIEIPVIFSHNFSFNIGKKIFDRLSLEVGPAIGILVSSSVNIDQIGFSPITGTPYKRIDLSGAIGFSYRISEKLKFHFRYENSILPIRKHESGATSHYNFHYNVGETNMVFTYSLSYTF